LISGLTREQDKRIFEKGGEKDVRKEDSETAKVEAPVAAPTQASAAEPAQAKDHGATPVPGYFDIPVRRDRERI
jgi:hypothetical protein